MLRDVSRRVAAERALAISEAHLRRALSGADMGDWRWEAASDRMFMSERTLAFYGLGPEHQGMLRPELRALVIHPDDIAAVKTEADEALIEHRQYETEYRVRRRLALDARHGRTPCDRRQGGRGARPGSGHPRTKTGQ
jgi:PAS domain-containing protein